MERKFATHLYRLAARPVILLKLLSSWRSPLKHLTVSILVIAVVRYFSAD